MKKFKKYLSLFLVMMLLILVYFYYPALNIITGYYSKNMASGLFVADRDEQSLAALDNGFIPISFADYEVNMKDKTVTSSIFGLMKRKAVYMEGLGAVLVNKESEAPQIGIKPNRIQTKVDLPFPYGYKSQKDSLFETIDYTKLKAAINNAFDKGDDQEKQTRSVLVMYGDYIIGERYAEGFDRGSLMHGWSMTKSLTSTMYGILQRQRDFDIHSPTGIQAWQQDDRSKITYANLLEMNSGLEWEEAYFNISDVTRMLYLAKDMGQAQIDKPLDGKPDNSWNYSSGTSNLLSGPLLRSEFETHQEYLDFWYRELIDKIGMHSCVIETDQVGNFIGSSYAWANTRDWAKFGLLYLKKGNWNGEQVLDTSFVDYVAKPTNSSEGRYGAQFWLNAGGYFPDAPLDMFSCNGFKGQYVFIIPSKNLVIVRTGLKSDPNFDVNDFIKEIVASIN